MFVDDEIVPAHIAVWCSTDADDRISAVKVELAKTLVSLAAGNNCANSKQK